MSGWSSSERISSHSVRETRRAKTFGSKAGDETIARISPVFGSSATALPTLSAKYSSAIFWSFRSIVRKSVLPGSGAVRSASPTSRPKESMTYVREPETPERRSW